VNRFEAYRSHCEYVKRVPNSDCEIHNYVKRFCEILAVPQRNCELGSQSEEIRKPPSPKINSTVPALQTCLDMASDGGPHWYLLQSPLSNQIFPGVQLNLPRCPIKSLITSFRAKRMQKAHRFLSKTGWSPVDMCRNLSLCLPSSANPDAMLEGQPLQVAIRKFKNLKNLNHSARREQIVIQIEEYRSQHPESSPVSPSSPASTSSSRPLALAALATVALTLVMPQSDIPMQNPVVLSEPTILADSSGFFCGWDQCRTQDFDFESQMSLAFHQQFCHEVMSHKPHTTPHTHTRTQTHTHTHTHTHMFRVKISNAMRVIGNRMNNE
jgi:hypothetical protein